MLDQVGGGRRQLTVTGKRRQTLQGDLFRPPCPLRGRCTPRAPLPRAQHPRVPRAGCGRSGVCAPARARGDTPLGALVPRQPARWLSGDDPPSPGSSPHPPGAQGRGSSPQTRAAIAHRSPLPGPGLPCYTSRRPPCGPRAPATGPSGAGVCAAVAASVGGRKGLSGYPAPRASGREAAGPRGGDHPPLSLQGLLRPLHTEHGCRPRWLSSPRSSSQPGLLGTPVPALPVPGAGLGAFPQEPRNQTIQFSAPAPSKTSGKPSPKPAGPRHARAVLQQGR